MTRKAREAQRMALHKNVWLAAIRFFVYRTPGRTIAAAAHLQKELTRYRRALRAR